MAAFLNKPPWTLEHRRIASFIVQLQELIAETAQLRQHGGDAKSDRDYAELLVDGVNDRALRYSGAIAINFDLDVRHSKGKPLKSGTFRESEHGLTARLGWNSESHVSSQECGAFLNMIQLVRLRCLKNLRRCEYCGTKWRFFRYPDGLRAERTCDECKKPYRNAYKKRQMKEVRRKQKDEILKELRLAQKVKPERRRMR